MASPRVRSIADDIVKRIESNEFDFRLPTVSDTVTHYRASRRTIAEVWDVLRARGYTTTRRGVGTYIKKRS